MNIGIVGAGIAGLHLGLYLRQHGIAATIYTQYSPEQQRATRLANIVARSAPTRERERLLGVNHWDFPAADLTRFSICVGGARPLTIQGDFEQAVSVVDMRIYTARLLEDFVQRGGVLALGAIMPGALEALTEQHDLLVVATGRAHFTQLFPRLPEYSPFDQPQRIVVAGLYRGIAPTQPRSMEVYSTPGCGEIIVLPSVSFEPDLIGIGVEIIPGGAFDRLRQVRYADDPRRFTMSMLDLLHKYAPAFAQRIDREAFAIARPLDHAYTAITPTVRRAYAQMPNGRFALALGDAHVVNDPLTGQGANTASHAAWTLGATIREHRTFDAAFCRLAEQRMWEYTRLITEACNARLGPPPPHVLQLLAEAAQRPPLAHAYINGFNRPDHIWRILSSSDATTRFLNQFVQAAVLDA